MNFLLSSRGLFGLAFIILVATNIVVLAGVAANRSGEPESQIILTERELQLPHLIHKENSGLALQITWRVLGQIEDYNGYAGWRFPIWLNAEKLRELGFNLGDYLSSNDNRSLYKQPIPKEVFIVLENNGDQYREAIRRAEVVLEREEKLFESIPDDKRLGNNLEKAKNRLQHELIEESRLFAINAGLDAGELRKKYGDRSRFIITKGLVEPRYTRDNNKKEVFGYISRLSVARIYVPLEHRQIFESILPEAKINWNELRSPRFKVKIAYGKRFEPWIVSVRSINDEAK